MPGTWYPNAEEHPPSPPSKGGRAERRGDVIPSKGEERSEALGKKQYLRWEGCKPDVTIVVHSHIHY